MTPSRWIAVGAWSAGLAVTLGAFGAHGLEDRVAAEQLEWWRTGVLYQMFHAAGLVLVGLHGARSSRASGWVGWAFLIGTVLFCGSLYAMTLGGPRWLGAITPLGGTSWIVGWVGLGLASWRTGPDRGPGPEPE